MILRWYSPSGVEIEFSRTSETYRLLKAYDGFSVAPITHLTRQAPFQHGATRINSHFEPREVSFDVRVTAPTLEDLQYAIRVLATALNPLPGEGTLVYTQEDGSEYVLYCIGNNTPNVSASDRTGTSQLVTINLIAYDPFWYSYPDSIAYFGAGAPVVFPFSLPWMFPTSTPAQVLTNLGNVATDVTIITSGAITNPEYVRTYTDAYGVTTTETLAFTLTMTAGEVLTITTDPDNLTITLLHDNGTYDANPFQYLNADPAFWQLVPGDNIVGVNSSAISAGTETRIQYASRFSGV